jgi:predicted dehydrogenase
VFDAFSRRSFLAHAVASPVVFRAAWGATPRGANSSPRRTVPPSEKIRVGFVGVGGMGSGTLNGFLGHADVDVPAVCDVYEPNARQAAERVEKVRGTAPKRYRDFRELLDHKDIDAVVVSTPDHWHALPSIMACQAGKDVYCEKPLAYSIAEGRAMVRAARANNRVTQMGTQIHAGENYHRVVEIVRSGALGTIHLCRVWIAMTRERDSKLGHPADSDPPAGLDWDFWLGPAPKRPFNKNRFLFNFRWFWDYAGGVLSDMGCHIMDLVHWSMQATAPLSATSAGHRYATDDNCEVPDTQDVLYEYPNSTGKPAFNVVWSHLAANSRGFEGRGLGIAFFGTNGTLIADYNKYEIHAEKGRMDGFKEPVPTLPRSPGHHREFLNAIKSREHCSCDWEYGHRLTSAVLLGNVALKSEKKIRWDATRELCVDSAGRPDADANRFLGREYRAPWKLPS